MVDYVTRAERRKNPDYRIAELEDEVERLQRQLSACKDIDRELGVLRETVERLRAENERWRERVKHLPDHSDCEAEVKRLRAVVVDDPSALTMDEFVCCFFCHGPDDSTTFELRQEDHKPDCPWVLARQALEETT
jgi:regulator of replication initiation timing